MTGAVDIAPDYVEPLRAWRAWRVVERDGSVSLASVVQSVVWPAGRTLVAQCLHTRRYLPWRRSHPAPLASCDCGIYGSTLERVVEYTRGRLSRNAIGCAVGVVALWGSVVECERGLRGSHAYPAELWVPWPEDGGRYDPADVALQLTAYGVPVRLLDGRADEAADVIPRATGTAA